MRNLDRIIRARKRQQSIRFSPASTPTSNPASTLAFSPASILALILAFSLGACTSTVDAGEGVSIELAKLRSEAVSDVHYDLKINIPDNINQPVGGECLIEFYLAKKTDLPVDYTGQTEGSELTVLVNGKEYPVTLAEEHIVLPARLLRKGRNDVKIPFVSSDKTLNRHEDYLYTLFVPANARSVFPCFDQPDLKATFTLTMDLPEGWKYMQSASTKPIPTYLFSFVAGKFQTKSEERGGRTITAFYRETDPGKVAQLPEIFDMAALSIRWMEDYTGVAYPYDYYHFVVLPGYQFGGMEHPGAIQFNDRRIFLPENATPSELLSRFNLIAHETAHMWFGDLVTMKWFDDVWTKEVFAGFFSDKISREQFPDINHDLNHVANHFPSAFATDRTAGTHPIRQNLDNLNSAGLLYGNIIYHKAPIMMQKIEERMGEAALQNALGEYLTTFAFGNATWDDLIAIMDRTAPEAGMKEFDKNWVKTAGIPEPDGTEQLHQMPYTVIEPENLPQLPDLLADFTTLRGEVARMMYSINVFENYKAGRILSDDAFNIFSEMLAKECNHLIASRLVNYLCSICAEMPLRKQPEIEARLYAISKSHELQPVRLQIKRYVLSSALNPEILKDAEAIWENQSDAQLSQRDYTSISYHLALMNPSRWEEILGRQRSFLSTEDDLREFDYISRACNPDTTFQTELFLSLIKPENRINEPWALSALNLLCDKTREEQACRYIAPALDSLQFIQRTSDIFFPGQFLSALLSSRKSAEAESIVNQWISEHPDYPESLMRKIKENPITVSDGTI